MIIILLFSINKRAEENRIKNYLILYSGKKFHNYGHKSIKTDVASSCQSFRSSLLWWTWNISKELYSRWWHSHRRFLPQSLEFRRNQILINM